MAENMTKHERRKRTQKRSKERKVMRVFTWQWKTVRTRKSLWLDAREKWGGWKGDSPLASLSISIFNRDNFYQGRIRAWWEADTRNRSDTILDNFKEEDITFPLSSVAVTEIDEEKDGTRAAKNTWKSKVKNQDTLYWIRDGLVEKEKQITPIRDFQ